MRTIVIFWLVLAVLAATNGFVWAGFETPAAVCAVLSVVLGCVYALKRPDEEDDG